MKKYLLIILALACALQVRSQRDTVTLVHENYTTTYDTVLKYPVVVKLWETSAKDSCNSKLPRKDQFHYDPLLKNQTNTVKAYDNSGYDRGHMCPAASNECSGKEVLTECFYMSNMAPQLHSLNAGDWKRLEVYTREEAIKFDSIRVWAGSVGVAKKVNGLSVPSQCWKVIHILKTNEWMAYIFDNTTTKQIGLDPHKTTIDSIEKLTGFKFD